jgi:CcmD family protein
MGHSADSPMFGVEYAVAAYVVIFTTIFVYVAWLHVSHRRLARRIAQLESELAARGRRTG